MITAGKIAARAIRRRIFITGLVLTALWGGVLPRYMLLDAYARPAASWTGFGAGLITIGLALAVLTVRLWRGARPHLAYRAALDFAIVSMLAALGAWTLNQRGAAVPYVESFSILVLEVATGWLASLGVYVWSRSRLRHLTGVAHLRGQPMLQTVFWVSATVVGGAAAVVLSVGSSARAAGALDRQAGAHLAALTDMMASALDASQNDLERLHIMHLLDTEQDVEATLLAPGKRPPGVPATHALGSGPGRAFVVLVDRARAHWTRQETRHGVLWLSTPANVRPPVRAPDDAPGMLILALLALGAPIAAWAVGQDLRAELRDVTRALDGMASGVRGGSLGVPVSSHDEVGDVASQLNRVCARYTNQHRLLTADLDAAEGSDRARGRFLAAASHELRTPLNTIAGYCHLLSADSELSAAQREDVHTIADAAGQLLGHVDEILGLSEMSSEAQLQREPVNVGALVESQVQRAPCPAGLRIVVQIDPETPTVAGDPRRLGQVVANLLSNALKFTGAGEVHVEVSPAHLALAPAARIEVRDDGPGIPTDELEAIFTEFHRVEAQREVVGTGLGLAIARRLVERHGGRIWAEATVGEGSTFTVLLPASTPREPLS